MKLFIEKSRFRVGAGERNRLWWKTEQTICLYYQKIIQIRIDILCLRQAQAPRVTRWLSRVEITRMRIRMCLRQAQAPKTTHWLSGAEITGSMSENVPSTGSGTDSSSKYNTVIELVEITRWTKYNFCLRELRSQTFSLCSGIGSVTEGGNIIPVIERSRNHQRNDITSTGSVT